jgi:diguanylate cyclase
VGKRDRSHLRLIDADLAPPFETRGRPVESRPFDWGKLTVRLLVIGWSGSVVTALVDQFGALPQLPFITAMGMTALLVAATFIVTRHGVPNWAGDVIETPGEDVATDLLTDLPTLAHFQRRIQDAFNRARRMAKPFSIVLVDVNNLTAVNKEYGVTAGDEVLRHVARAIDSTRRYNDVVSRMGDDEFGVLLVDCGEDGVRAFVDRLEDRLARESAMADVKGRMISLWAGICTGSATATAGYMEASEVLEEAIRSLDAAKDDRERRRRLWLSA